VPSHLKMLEKFRSRARALKKEAIAVYIAAKDPRTPWYAKALVFFVVIHTFSPIDLIPDFIPILGYLDDLIITPLGLMLAIRMIPAEVLADAREKAKQAEGPARSVEVIGVIFIVIVWIVILISILSLIKFSS
jgi:uncharacterized membrane protein YkvA (DUF1232 family)